MFSLSSPTGLTSSSSRVSDTPVFSVVAERSVRDILFLKVRMLTVEGSDGVRFERVVVRHPGAVAIVAFVHDEVLMIRQYRAAVDEMLLEIPAGKLDIEGEEPGLAAIRELEEEVGYTAGRVEHLLTFYTGPGFTDERIIVFMAHDLSSVEARPHGAEEEAAEVVRLPRGSIAGMIASGEIRDAKTVVGLQAALLTGE